MNINIAIISLSLLVILLVYQISIWKIRVLLSPGFYFALIWSLGIISLLLFKVVGVLIETYPEYIDELNILLGYTAVCFIVVSKFGRKRIVMDSIVIDYIKSNKLFKFLSFFYFFISLYVFLVEGSGLDFASARNSIQKTIENRSALVGYFRLLSVPLSIHAGSKLTNYLLGFIKIKKGDFLFFILPFISDTLFSLTEGGRVAMVYSMLLYLVGAALSVPLNFNSRVKFKIIFYGLIIAYSLNLMISWVGSVRSKADGTFAVTQLFEEKLGYFSFLYGSMQYVNSSFIGYQYRRVDAVDNSRLGYGIYTFNGFINGQIPFASRFGFENASIAKALDIFYFNQETYDFSRDFYYTTHSSFIPIIKDFGFSGSFFAIFVIVVISHYFFVKIQSQSIIKKSLSFLFYFLFLFYWAKSNFYGTLSESILIPIYSFLIIDFFNNLIHKKV